MPKVKPSVYEWIKDHTELKYENNRLICKACLKTINSEKKFNIIQHIKTATHVENLKKFQKDANKQTTLFEAIVGASSSSQDQKTFYFDLCNAMVSSNIPLSKLENGAFKDFLQKYCGMHIPSESTIRKNYVDLVYKDVINQIKDIIGNNYIWFTVDETTDSCGRYVAHLMIGVLHEESTSKAYLINSKELEKTNNNTVTRFIHESFANFFLPNIIPSEKILLMVSDAAAYMCKSYSNLKILFPNLIHCTCLAHGFNRVAESVRLAFPMINELVKHGKKIFVKAPLRVQFFKEKLPGVPLPPEPVITRWGTWLEATIYYADNFEKFKAIIMEFDESSSNSIKKCQELVNKKELLQKLTFIKAHYSYISTSIRKLETRDFSLTEAVDIVNIFKNSTSKVPGDIGKTVNKKLNDVLAKNIGFNTLKQIAEVLNGSFENESKLEIPENLIIKFKNAPITSVEVERSFSKFKHVLSDRRNSFLMENLEKHLVIALYKN